MPSVWEDCEEEEDLLRCEADTVDGRVCLAVLRTPGQRDGLEPCGLDARHSEQCRLSDSVRREYRLWAQTIPIPGVLHMGEVNGLFLKILDKHGMAGLAELRSLIEQDKLTAEEDRRG